METNNSKRKRRKTRKCLNELRKRSRSGSFIGHNITSRLEADEMKSVSFYCNKTSNNNNYLTTNRLTLAMFPKAITSSTITRPALAAIRLEDSSILQKGNDTKVISKIENTKNRVDVYCNKREMPEPLRETNLINNSLSVKDWPLSPSENKTSSVESQISEDNMLSPSSKTEERNVLEKASISISCGSSSSIAGADCRQNADQDQFYEQFINEIPHFLKENVPGLFQLNPVSKLREDLHKLFVESCEEESRNNILKCIKSRTSKQSSACHTAVSTSENIVENPRDYITLGNAWKQELLQGNSSSSSSSSTPTPRPLQPSTPLIPSSPTFINIIQDTPEYQYYPHKLNQ